MAETQLSSSVDFENYKFISLLDYSGDNRKVSRKKQLLNARQEQLFVPEGHCSCILWERKRRTPRKNLWASHQLEEQDTENRLHGS